MRATGGFLPAAAAMGIPTARVKIVCFMLCSVLAGFAGMIQVLRLGSPLPSIGEGLELQAVAAAVIGGASLAGGIGTVDRRHHRRDADPRHRQRPGAVARSTPTGSSSPIGVLTIFAVVANAWMRKRGRGDQDGGLTG